MCRGEQGSYPAEAVILATGGVSYPATGSTGEGHRMAEAAGHTVDAPCLWCHCGTTVPAGNCRTEPAERGTDGI